MSWAMLPGGGWQLIRLLKLLFCWPACVASRCAKPGYAVSCAVLAGLPHACTPLIVIGSKR